eukprot:7973400-Pyramimonas_sp.AAC.1
MVANLTTSLKHFVSVSGTSWRYLSGRLRVSDEGQGQVDAILDCLGRVLGLPPAALGSVWGGHGAACGQFRASRRR